MKLLTIILHLFLVLTVSARQSAYGTIEQVTHYYPFGAPYSDSSIANPDLQPYKYNAKEFDTAYKLNTYDYDARQYDPLLTVWHGVDPLCEKDYTISTSVYCRNNPVKLIDTDGEVTTIAASALVLGGIKVGSHEIWGGVPAKFIKKTAPNQAESYAAHYAQYAKDYLAEGKEPRIDRV